MQRFLLFSLEHSAPDEGIAPSVPRVTDQFMSLHHCLGLNVRSFENIDRDLGLPFMLHHNAFTPVTLSSSNAESSDPQPQSLDEMEKVLKQRTLRQLCDLACQVPTCGGSEEIQVLRTAILSTTFGILRGASDNWKAKTKQSRERDAMPKGVRPKRRRTSQSDNDNDAPWSCLDDDFELFQGDDENGTTLNVDEAVRSFLPERDSESMLRILKHFGRILGDHRDFNYTNGSVTPVQYMEAFAKCNKAYPFQEYLLMIKE